MTTNSEQQGETPRTDAAATSGDRMQYAEVVSANFARQLERELNALKEKHPRCYTRCPACHNDTLIINQMDGKLVCTWLECKDPTLIHHIDEKYNALKPINPDDVRKMVEALQHFLGDGEIELEIKQAREALSSPTAQYFRKDTDK